MSKLMTQLNNEFWYLDGLTNTTKCCVSSQSGCYRNPIGISSPHTFWLNSLINPITCQRSDNICECECIKMPKFPWYHFLKTSVQCSISTNKKKKKKENKREMIKRSSAQYRQTGWLSIICCGLSSSAHSSHKPQHSNSRKGCKLRQ